MDLFNIMGVKDVESNVVFRRTRRDRRTGKNEFEISDEHVRLQGKSQGIIIINFRATQKNDLMGIYEFFDNVEDMEPVTMNIADTGEIEHYFKGISPLIEEEDGIYKFSVTMQTLRKAI